MAQLIPFRAVHFNPSVVGDDLGDLIAPPYDVVDAVEGKRLLDRHPYNAIRLELTIPAPDDLDGRRYTEAARLWTAWLGTGVLVKDEREGLYLYEHEFNHDGNRLVRTAVVGLLKLAAPAKEERITGPWGATGVIPHEETLSQPKEDRFRLLVCTRGAQFSPIMAVYEDGDGTVSGVLQAVRNSASPDLRAVTEGEVLRVWRITDPDAVERIVRAVAAGPVVIADGHHRCESMKRFAFHIGRPDHCTIMTALVCATDPGVVVLPTHRILSGWPPDAIARILELVGREFAVAGAAPLASVTTLAEAQTWWTRLSPLIRFRDGGTSLVAVMREEAWVLSYPDETAEALRSLDMILEEVGSSLRGISPNPACTVAYTRDAPAGLEGIASGRVQIGFFPPAIPVSDVVSKARQGYLFPRKTTYFQPKVPAGLLMCEGMS
ncbi:MAG: DUF1015 domain-containing protein [Bacillota bacterium]